ncbi:MAG TPA: ATP-binding protein, partial [Planctomycetota bacterium]|nr:ATP-binding protein [Planctomycetota bacterium]
FVVSTASTGKQALALSQKDPDLIILDVRLPDISGTEVCRRLKAEPATSAIPVLHISASLITPEDRTAALEGGADGYLTEPLDPEELVASVKALLRMRRAEDVARKAAAEWKTTFDTIQDGIAVADEQWAIIRCNEAFLRLTGHAADDVPGMDLRELLSRVLRSAEIDRLTTGTDRSIRQARDLPLDGRWIRLTLDPILSDSAISGSICILSDETERTAAQLKVEELNATLEKRVAERTERLQAAIQELEAYSYSIAHDLRAPLRAIHRFSEIVLADYGSQIDATGKDFIRRIVAGAEKMDALINGLLDYSRLAQSELHPQVLQPTEIVTAVLRSLTAETPGGIPDIAVDPALPAIIGDRLLLYQAFENLISNALKFVAKNTVPKVTVTGERRGGRVILSVTDNGLGIPPESQGRLFRVFERLGDTLEYPGTGIGLAIVRRAMERMGGDCGVESDVGKGSRFWCRLPAAPAREERPG